MINITIIVSFLIFMSALSHASLEKKEIRILLQSTEVFLDPGGVQDSQSLFVSRQVNCQFVRSQGSVFTLDAAIQPGIIKRTIMV